MSDTTTIEDLRKSIDELDEQIVTLLTKRARAALAIGDLKTASAKAAYDPARERQVLDKIDALNKGPLSKGALEDIYADIITACREIQIKQQQHTS